jgi:hypothetical protein
LKEKNWQLEQMTTQFLTPTEPITIVIILHCRCTPIQSTLCRCSQQWHRWEYG